MHNRRRSARRKLWEITTYKDSKQHISDSDDEEEEEEKAKTKCRKKSIAQYYEKNAVEDWTSCGSGFNYKEESERSKICDVVHLSEEKALIETASCSDDENLHTGGMQLSISEISCSSDKPACFVTNQYDHQDFNEDSSDCNTPSISDLIENSQANLSSNEKVYNVPYTISPPSSPLDGANCNTKGSDWLSKISWQPRSHKEECTKTEFDSGKKKKKFLSGGFADQLHKLQSREKSAKAFWDYHSHDNQSPLCGKESMIFKLTETTHSYGTVVCRAVIIKSHHLKELDLFQSSTNNMDSNTSLIAKDNEGMCKKYIILLDYDQYEKLSISAGSLLQLFAPWKVLHLTNFSEPILLCTYFLQIVKKDQLFLESDEKNYQKQDGTGAVT